MKGVIGIAFILPFIFTHCKSKPVSLSEQLEKNLLIHLNKIDSTIVLDSFGIIKIDTMVERLGKMIEDVIYKMEMRRVEAQLANAVKEQKPDSIEFYQGEVNYMQPQSDSLTKVISTADTTRKFGLLVICKARLKKNNQSRTTLLYYYLDNHMTIRNSDRVDNSVSELSREMN